MAPSPARTKYLLWIVQEMTISGDILQLAAADFLLAPPKIYDGF